MKAREIQERLCKIMHKLDPSSDHVYAPGKSIEDDLDFLSILTSAVMLDKEALVREAEARGGRSAR